ncbi:hypothetical protein T265_15665, partial [Opisthorchis viverrini]
MSLHPKPPCIPRALPLSWMIKTLEARVTMPMSRARPFTKAQRNPPSSEKLGITSFADLVTKYQKIISCTEIYICGE